MSGFTIATLVILALALAGVLFKKNGELAGLGRESRRGGLRAPHGRLVRTKRLDALEDIGFFKKFIRVFVFSSMPTVIILILCLVGVFSVNGMAATGLNIIIVIAITVGVTQSDVGVWHPLGYSIAGYLVFAFASIAIASMALGPNMDAQVGLVNGIALVAGTVGSAAAVSWMPLIRTYAREFEDGHVNVIQVASRSVAAKAYDQLADKSWKPPADRIAHPEYADDPRAAYREKK